MNLVEKVGLFLSARELPKLDMLSNTDPFAALFYSNPITRSLDLVGFTNVIRDSQNPDWTTHFVVDFHFESNQEFIVRVYDQDGEKPVQDFSKHDFCGEAKFLLSTVMSTSGLCLAVNLIGGKNKGFVNIRAEAVSNTRDIFVGSFVGTKLINTDGWFGRSDPFLRFHRVYEDGQWGLVYETPHIDNNLNPKFPTLRIPMLVLCNGDYDRPVKIEIWDHESSGKHQFMGQVETSVRGIINSEGHALDVIEPLKREKKKNYVNSGTLTCNNPYVEKNPSFVDYILGGCEISLVVGIDFTGSNGPVTDPSSLHFIHPTGVTFNQYQQAIRAVGDIVQEYDSDKKYPVYGFGAKVRLPNGTYTGVQHCFPIYGGGVEVQGVEGILQAYNDCLANVSLSGPTLFAPLIEAASSIAQASQCSQNNQKYTILLILTDGEINDMEATINSIIRASYQPLSIIIVGVGNADFSNMVTLDGDNGLLRRGNNVAARDIVQFVPFRDFISKGASMLAAEVLAEIPDQLLQYMNSKKITPLLPRSV